MSNMYRYIFSNTSLSDDDKVRVARTFFPACFGILLPLDAVTGIIWQQTGCHA